MPGVFSADGTCDSTNQFAPSCILSRITNDPDSPTLRSPIGWKVTSTTQRGIWLAHVSRLRTSKELENSEKWNKEMTDRKRVFKLESRVKAALDTCRLHQASHRRGRRKRHDRLRSLYKGKSVSLTTHNFLLFLRTIIFLIKLLCAFLLFFFFLLREEVGGFSASLFAERSRDLLNVQFFFFFLYFF